ncbi:hypothetical protein ASE75_14750 [Sphingomonas sp. Leaf17]|nr:hypothetical protein ASE75_14750 [Sphingomonas sp. Leaf17]
MRKAAVDASVLRHMLAEVTGDTPRARRDRAVLAIGMAAALRRSELVALTLSDVTLVDAGLEIRITSSKTDRAGEGAVIAVPEGSRIRPKALLLAWMAALASMEADSPPDPTAPLFRRLTRGDALTAAPMSDRAVARLVKRTAAAAGYDPTTFSAHSLRAGFLTEAASQGATIFKMQEVSRHRTVQILSYYVRAADRFRDHAGDRFL